MGFLSDIKKKFNAASSTGLDGYGERSILNSDPRGRPNNVSKNQPVPHQRQPRQRPHGPGAGSDSQDSGVVIVQKDSNVTLTKVPENECPNCTAAATARHNLGNSRPSMEHMHSYSSSKQHTISSYGGHTHDHRGLADARRDHSRPGTGYSNQSGVPPVQTQYNIHRQQDTGFSSRPVSWGRRATTENVGHDGPCGYNRPVTPPYSIRSEQTGWNSGQKYNDMYGHAPGPASHDGGYSQRPLSWRRATSSHVNVNDQDPRQPRSLDHTVQNSRTPSESGSAHPRNASRNMEKTAYEAGYRDAIARLRADADRW